MIDAKACCSFNLSTTYTRLGIYSPRVVIPPQVGEMGPPVYYFCLIASSSKEAVRQYFCNSLTCFGCPVKSGDGGVFRGGVSEDKVLHRQLAWLIL